MLINLRNALMAGKRLPYDAEVEYLESTGTQYIDTGVSIDDNNYEIIVDFQQVGQPSTAWMAAFTQYTSETAEATRLINYDRRTDLVYVGYRRQANAQAAYNINTTVRREYRLSLQRLQVYTDGVLTGDVSLNAPSGSPGQGATMKLARMSGRYFAFKVIHNGVLVRDFIPVRKGTVGYLYDRVSGKLFGNAGTGDFQYGQDVVPVAYLRHTGTQWIDTGYAMADSRKIDIRVNWSAHSTTSREMMGGGTSGSYFIEVNANGYYAVGANASTISSIKAEGTDNLTWAYNVGAKPTLSVNGTLAVTDANIRVPSGTFKTAITASFAPHCDLYALDIYTDNDEQTRRMLPVRVGTEGAMMDVLTRRIYRNAGTGAFAYGNDLKYPIPAS